MPNIKDYQNIFQIINIQKFVEKYPIVGNYGLMTRVLNGTDKMSKNRELRCQSALLDFSDDLFEGIEKISYKPFRK